MSKTERIFTGRPLIIMIEVNEHGEWDIRPSSRDNVPAGGRTHKDEMKARADELDKLDTPIIDEWQSRRAARAPNRPHYKTEDHTPVVVFPGEKVQFQCQGGRDFAVWVERDPNVTVVADTPNNPFGFTVPQNFKGQSEMMTVADNIAAQRFYKCTAWIDVDGKTVVVDPDVIGHGL